MGEAIFAPLNIKAVGKNIKRRKEYQDGEEYKGKKYPLPFSIKAVGKKLKKCRGT